MMLYAIRVNACVLYGFEHFRHALVHVMKPNSLVGKKYILHKALNVLTVPVLGIGAKLFEKCNDWFDMIYLQRDS